MSEHIYRVSGAVTSAIAQRVFSVDSQHVLLPYPLSDSERSELNDVAGYEVPYITLKYDYHFKRRLNLRQPQRAEWKLLNKMSPHAANNFLDLAMDLETDSLDDAGELHEFVARHQDQKWHGKRQCNTHKRTSYSHVDASSPRGIRRYHWGHSKITGNRRCRLEFTYRGLNRCRRIGLETIDDLLDLTPKRWLRIIGDEFRLSYFDPARARAAFIRQAMKMQRTRRWFRFPRDEIAEHLEWRVCRAMQDSSRTPTLDEIRDYPMQVIRERIIRDLGFDSLNCALVRMPQLESEIIGANRLGYTLVKYPQ